MKVMLMIVTVLLVATHVAVINSQIVPNQQVVQCISDLVTEDQNLLNCLLSSLPKVVVTENLSPSAITTFCDSSCAPTLENAYTRCNYALGTSTIQFLCTQCFGDRISIDQDLRSCYTSVLNTQTGIATYCGTSCRSTLERTYNDCNFAQGTTTLEEICNNGGITSNGSGALMVVLTLASLVAVILHVL